ncbi:MAG: YcxB family protein [Oscillibacter sp.]|nr:YcxB family protein [Oscillibacter sp.]
MGTLELNFKVTVKDFREATYYGLFMNKRNFFRAAVVVIAACFIYVVLSVNKVLTMEPIFFFLAGGYLVWTLFLLAGAERQIRAYVKSPDNLLGAEYTARFGQRLVSFEIPARNFKVSGNLADLPAAFELSNIFLVYANQQQTFIIPTRCMSKGEIQDLRALLSHGLGDRFYTMFGKKKT